MKKYLASAVLLVLALLLVSPTSASAATNPGVKPGSFFYGFVTTFERVNLFFTFNPEKKAEKALKYAEKRLAEAEAVAGDENSDAVKTAILGYEENIALAVEASKKVKDETKAENLLNLIAENTSKHQEVLADVLSKVPDEAKEAITKAIEASKKGQEEAINKIAELKNQVEQLQQEVTELKKRQSAETASNQTDNAQTQSTSAKELKKEVEELKKQAAEKEKRKKQASTLTTPAPSTIQATTPQTEVKVENQAVTLTHPDGRSFDFEDPIINKQRVRDLIDLGFIVTKGKLPEGIIIKPNVETATAASISTSTESLAITSASVAPDVTSARIEWQTNKPANSKIFISGGSLSSKVYNSESGLSTRHIVNATSLTSNTDYLYEIESIAGDQVIKKNGSFSTKKGELTIQADKTLVQLTRNSATITARYTENGKTVPVEISFSAPDISKIYQVIQSPPECGSIPFIIRNFGQTTGGGCTLDGTVSLDYQPKSLGVHTISVAAKGVSKSIDIQVTEYVKVEPKLERLPVYQQDANNTSYSVEVPEFKRSNHYSFMAIGRFKLSQDGQSISLSDGDGPRKYESDLQFDTCFRDSQNNQICKPRLQFQYYGGEYTLVIDSGYNDYTYANGTHYVKLIELPFRGIDGVLYKQALGLPITFTFTISQ